MDKQERDKRQQELRWDGAYSTIYCGRTFESGQLNAPSLKYVYN